VGALGGARKLLVAGERDVILTSNLSTIASVADDISDVALGSGRLFTTSLLAYLNNAGTGSIERARTPHKWLAVATAAAQGTTTIYTPPAGKKFRLHQFRILVTGNAALAVAAQVRFWLADGGVDVNLQDAAMWIPAVAGTGPTLYVGPDIVIKGNGYLSTAANNVLALRGDAAAALTSGQMLCQVAVSDE
jgi:hypothetical protein